VKNAAAGCEEAPIDPRVSASKAAREQPDFEECDRTEVEIIPTNETRPKNQGTLPR
jgi:hypothetical protein